MTSSTGDLSQIGASNSNLDDVLSLEEILAEGGLAGDGHTTQAEVHGQPPHQKRADGGIAARLTKYSQILKPSKDRFSIYCVFSELKWKSCKKLFITPVKVQIWWDLSKYLKQTVCRRLKMIPKCFQDLALDLRNLGIPWTLHTWLQVTNSLFGFQLKSESSCHDSTNKIFTFLDTTKR